MYVTLSAVLSFFRQSRRSVTRHRVIDLAAVAGTIRGSISARDLFIGAVACVVLVYFFARIELVELVGCGSFATTR